MRLHHTNYRAKYVSKAIYSSYLTVLTKEDYGLGRRIDRLINVGVHLDDQQPNLSKRNINWPELQHQRHG